MRTGKAGRRHFKDQRYRLSVYVVMDDHVHVVPQTPPGHDLSRVLLSLKTWTATRINKLRGKDRQTLAKG